MVIVFPVEPQKEMDGAALKKTDSDLNLDGSQLKFDGPEKYFPKYGDVVLCMAIIEGYSAVRCPEKGIFKRFVCFFSVVVKQKVKFFNTNSIMLVKFLAIRENP